MSVSYHIHLHLGLVYIRYSGFAVLQDSFEAVGRYLQDPDFRPGQKQLIDLSMVTDFEKDYAKLFELQAKKAEALLHGTESLFVYYAPTNETQSMAQLICRSWNDIAAVVPVVVATPHEASSVLGISAQDFEALAARHV